jgi:adenylate kinase
MIISEIKNPTYEIEPIKMKNDAFIPGVEAPLPQAFNFMMICCGAPGSGKSTFFLNLINKRSKNTYYKKFHKIFIFSNSLHTISQKIKLPEDRMFQGTKELPDVIESVKESDDKVLIILDDVISEIKSDEFFMKLLFNRRHIAGGISIILMTQVWNKLPLPLRKVASHLVLFNSTNKKELTSIFDDFVTLPREVYDQVVRYVFDKKHNFLFMDTANNLYYKNFNPLTIQE